jgi:alpha-tubulin suppressor-like RCC1 family protein
VRVPGLGQIEGVAVGDRITCARRKNQNVLCFGQFARGVPASAAATPAPELRGVSVLALGHSSHAALDPQGAILAWGSNNRGQLLDGTREARQAPVSGSGVPPLAMLAWSAVRACAVTRSGDALCWGDSGRNTIDPPTRVKLAGKISRVALGANHACALGVDGSVWCWGDGFYGATGSRAGAELPTSAFWTQPRQVL